jgi:phosphate uptake regulator
MWHRKIQFIAGSTYTISLPKEWVLQNGLKEKKELTILLQDNNSLILSPEKQKKSFSNEMKINLEEELHNLDQIIFIPYYLDIETIHIISKKEISKEERMKILQAVTHMSGTEITYEDKNRITIKSLLDKSKININQIIYRINLLIDSSLSNLASKINKKEVLTNELEIDRLYHLMVKIISLSSRNQSILNSSKIESISKILPLFLINKKLENLGDDIYHLSKYMVKRKLSLKTKKKIIETIQKELNRTILHLINHPNKSFIKLSKDEISQIKIMIESIQDKKIVYHLHEALRYLNDIEEEVVNIYFYNKLN